jgi:integrase/recombinase XerD
MAVSYSNKFYLKPEEGAKRLKIYQRIIVNRQKAELYTGLQIEPKHWDEGKQRTTVKNNVLDKRLSEKEHDLHTLISKLEKEKKVITVKMVKKLLKSGEDADNAYLLDFIARYIAQKEQDNETVERTIFGYKNFLRHLTAFVASQKLGPDVPLGQVDYGFLRALDSYLLQQKAAGKGEGKLQRNTINKHHTRFRAILHQAVREDLILKNPYKSFQLRDTPTKRKYLTEEELQILIDHDLGGNASLQRVRDIFIWSVYTGLRYQDAMDLEAKQVRKDGEGNYFFQFYQNKTGESVSIPLLDPAVEIFKRYNNDERKATGKVLPRMSNQKVNTYLKVIGDLVGIETPITHHVARHTCATTVLLANGISMEIVSEWLGHSDVNTTQIYGKITNQVLMRAGKDMKEKLKKKK